MVPGVVRVVEALPRLANGKLDRQAVLAEPLPEPLPEPAAGPAAGPALEPGVPPPGRGLQVWVAQAQALFAGLLGTPAAQVGPDCDFFALGGHSLLLLRLGAEIERRHCAEVEMDELLARPTAAQLGSLLADRAAGVPGGTERTAV